MQTSCPPSYLLRSHAPFVSFSHSIVPSIVSNPNQIPNQVPLAHGNLVFNQPPPPSPATHRKGVVHRQPVSNNPKDLVSQPQRRRRRVPGLTLRNVLRMTGPTFPGEVYRPPPPSTAAAPAELGPGHDHQGSADGGVSGGSESAQAMRLRYFLHYRGLTWVFILPAATQERLHHDPHADVGALLADVEASRIFVYAGTNM